MNGPTDTYGMPIPNGQHGMQNYTFAQPNNMGGYNQDKKSAVGSRPSNIQLANPTPDYVFVDEHNRHKRLKGKVISFRRTVIMANICGSHESL